MELNAHVDPLSEASCIENFDEFDEDCDVLSAEETTHHFLADVRSGRYRTMSYFSVEEIGGIFRPPILT